MTTAASSWSISAIVCKFATFLAACTVQVYERRINRQPGNLSNKHEGAFQQVEQQPADSLVKPLNHHCHEAVCRLLLYLLEGTFVLVEPPALWA